MLNETDDFAEDIILIPFSCYSVTGSNHFIASGKIATTRSLAHILTDTF